MNAMIEQVAEAIWLANESCRVDTDWDEEEDSIKRQYRMLARAAIEAIAGKGGPL